MNNNIDINKSNYESYVIDYLDGTLNAIDTANFIAFLEENPDIKEEVAGLDSIALMPEITEFTKKSKLKKEPFFSTNEISELNYVEYFIAFYEGDLSESEKIDLQYFLDKNPGLVSEYNLFDKLKIVPNTDIVFTDKSILHHKKNIVPIWISTAAAVLVLFAAYWFLFNQQSNALQRDLYSLSKIIPKEINSGLSIKQIAIIDLKERELLEIKTEDKLPAIRRQKDINISPLLSKTNSEQLVNCYDFARLANQKEIEIILSNTVNEELIASTEPISKKQHRGLIAKIFNNQKERINKIIRFKRSNKVKSSDPTYIKVLDKSLLVFNTITGSETDRVRTYNTEGELTSFQIEGQEVLLSRRFPEKSVQ